MTRAGDPHRIEPELEQQDEYQAPPHDEDELEAPPLPGPDADEPVDLELLDAQDNEPDSRMSQEPPPEAR